jgi:hypothetical protein
MQKWSICSTINVEGGLFFMVEKYWKIVIDEMVPPRGENGDEDKIWMFITSKKAVNR